MIQMKKPVLIIASMTENIKSKKSTQAHQQKKKKYTKKYSKLKYAKLIKIICTENSIVCELYTNMGHGIDLCSDSDPNTYSASVYFS